MGLSFYTAKHEPTEVGCRYSDWKEFVWAVGDAIGLKRSYPPDGRWDWAHPWPDNPLVALCRHDPCDGDIGPDECGKIATALWAVSPKLPEKWMRGLAERLSVLMQECADEDKYLIFS